LDVYEHKIGAIVFGSAERVGSSARITGDFVAELRQLVFEALTQSALRLQRSEYVFLP